MKAIVLHGKGDIRFETDFPDPSPAAGEVLLKMTYSSICQTDIEVWQQVLSTMRRQILAKGDMSLNLDACGS